MSSVLNKLIVEERYKRQQDELDDVHIIMYEYFKMVEKGQISQEEYDVYYTELIGKIN